MPKRIVVNSDGKPIDENNNVIEGGDTDIKGITAEAMMKIIRAAPPDLNPLGLANVIINLMATYDFLPQWRLVLAVTAKALDELETEQPDLFKQGGFRKHLLELNGIPEKFN